MGGVYAVDKQLEFQPDGTIQIDEEIDQRLNHSLHDFAQAINLRQPVVNGSSRVALTR